MSKSAKTTNIKNNILRSSGLLKKSKLDAVIVHWLLLVGLGVGAVISGEFAGWNFGLAHGGLGGMMMATIFIGIMYFFMSLILADLSAALPVSGSGYAYAHIALGRWGGYFTGLAILLEYVIALSIISIFINDYLHELMGIDGITVFALMYLIFIVLNIFGTKVSLHIIFIMTLLALCSILIFLVVTIPYFNWSHLLSSHIDTQAMGASALFPKGYMGIWTAIPFAIWLFLAVEGIPLAAEETVTPSRNLPISLMISICILCVIAVVLVIVTTGVSGIQFIQHQISPLSAALNVTGLNYKFLNIIMIVGTLSGLCASFFAIFFLSSRQMFALSQAGCLPQFLSVSYDNKISNLTLVLPGIVAFILALTRASHIMINMVVLNATLSYVLMMLSYIILRFKKPNMLRPYKALGGIFTAFIALLLSLTAFLLTFFIDLYASFWTIALYSAMMLFFILCTRQRNL